MKRVAEAAAWFETAAQEIRARREARSHEHERREQADDARARALVERIAPWWSGFVAEFRRAAEDLAGLTEALPPAYMRARFIPGEGRCELQAGDTSVAVTLAPDGYLSVHRLVAGSGFTEHIALTPTAEGIEPPPDRAVQVIFTPWLAILGRAAA